ncbi:MAG: DNA polymerase III subunit chi [Janthinobacterium lividum]
MTEVGFYQLAAKPLEAVLPRLLEKALAAGHRVVVRSSDEGLLARLDAALWTYDAASFLPHAVDGDHAAAQPVLLTGDAEVANGADVLAVVDGALPDDFAGFRRLLYLFDGGDDAALARARQHWRGLRGRADVSPTYWREDETGRWAKAG